MLCWSVGPSVPLQVVCLGGVAQRQNFLHSAQPLPSPPLFSFTLRRAACQASRRLPLSSNMVAPPNRPCTSTGRSNPPGRGRRNIRTAPNCQPMDSGIRPEPITTEPTYHSRRGHYPCAITLGISGPHRREHMKPLCLLLSSFPSSTYPVGTFSQDAGTPPRASV